MIDPRYPMSLAHRTWPELIRQPDEVLAALAFDRELWVMPHQRVPAASRSKLLWFGGRGAAKTVAETFAMLDAVDAGVMRFLIAGRTADDIRVFIEGPSGLQAWSAPDRQPRYLVSKKKVVFYTGAEALCVSIEQGPEVAFKGKGFEFGVLLEISTWGDDLEEAWKQCLINARIGTPRIIADANPLPDNVYLRRLVNEADARGITVVPVSSYDNANNVPEDTRKVYDELAQTSLGRCEVYPEFLTLDGALWKAEWIKVQPAPERGTTVIAVDPAGTFNRHSDEHGIICARASTSPTTGKRVAHVLEDASFKGEVTAWPLVVADLARRHHASRVIIEKNRGLDYLKAAVKPHLPHITLEEITVTRSKDDRAIPVAQLYELGRVYHDHRFEVLEDQMTSWIPASQETARAMRKATSPDRLDALVHAISALNLGLAPVTFTGIRQPERRS